MPAHNTQLTIRTALRSTLRSLPRDAEIHVWDDGSTDQTAQIADAIADRRIRVHRSDVSVGSGAARQQLLERTDSEFVAAMDADDVSLPWRFLTQLRQLENADIGFCAAIRFDPSKGRIRPTSPLSLSAKEIPRVLLIHNPLTHSAMIAKRNAIVGVGGYRDIRRGQDYDLWLRAASQGVRIVRSGLPVVGYRESASQISTQPEYGPILRADPRIRESYLQLYSKVMNDDPTLLASADEAPQLTGMRWSKLPAGMSMAKRYYYRRLIRTRLSTTEDGESMTIGT